MSFDTKLDKLVTHHNELRDALATHTMADPQEFAKLSKEYSDLTPIAEAILLLRSTEKEIADLELMLADSTTEKDMKEFAEQELQELKEKLPELEMSIKIQLLPKDADDE